MLTRTHFVRFVERARHLPALAAAFVHPCDAETLQLALTGAFTGTLAPVLVGPEARIRDAAAKAAIDIARLPIVDTEDDPRASAARAVELARSRRVHALVKVYGREQDSRESLLIFKAGKSLP
jgi:phosphate acetyltransferase